MKNKKTQIVTTLQTHIVIKLQTQKTLIAKKIGNKSFDEPDFDNSNSKEEFFYTVFW